MSLSSANVSNLTRNRPPGIDLGLRNLRQLFNSVDPSPFNDKDLDEDGEEFIVSSAQEFPRDTVLHLAERPAEDPTELICSAIDNYFAYREKLNRHEFRLLMKRGRVSLIIGMFFLVT